MSDSHNVRSAAFIGRSGKLNQWYRSSQRLVLVAALYVFVAIPLSPVSQFADSRRSLEAFRGHPIWVNATNQDIDGCKVSGCGREVCTDHAVASPCIWNPQFECYKDAVCAIQADGRCSWTMTAKLKACLKKKKPGPSPIHTTPPS